MSDLLEYDESELLAEESEDEEEEEREPAAEPAPSPAAEPAADADEAVKGTSNGVEAQQKKGPNQRVPIPFRPTQFKGPAEVRPHMISLPFLALGSELF